VAAGSWLVNNDYALISAQKKNLAYFRARIVPGQ
jgi:hypothetical protein